MIGIGDRIIANKMGEGSFYLQAEGIVTAIKNGIVNFDADYVKDRYSKVWKKHPTSCATADKIENVYKIFTIEQSVREQLK